MTDGAGTFLRPTPLEVASGWIHGVTAPEPLPVSTTDPLDALRAAVRPALAAGDCYVTFSGGRDSSAVLAVACDVARREGLPLPVPVTFVYPQDPGADEASWQHLVIDHLGLSEWVRLDVGEQTDYLGHQTREGIRRRGVLLPAALQVQDTRLRHLRGGTVLTGEAGDEVLGPHRATPVLLFRRRRPRREVLPAAARAVAPRPVRRRLTERDLRGAAAQVMPWLRPDAAAEHARLAAADLATEPLHWGESVWWLRRRRGVQVMRHNRDLVAAEHDVRMVDPLADPAFLAALAAAGGRWGYRGRTALMRVLFRDLLPDPILARSQKAWFNTSFFGPRTREFARQWDGTGVDTSLVDAQRLRTAWLAPVPSGLSAALLHTAWLASDSTAEVAR